MSLLNYRALGESGLIVSPLSLGTMTFGTNTWGASPSESKSIFTSYVEAGGNFVDTADIYSDGVSEEMTGQFIKDMGLRDQIVLATKFGFNASSSPLSTKQGLGNPNAGGAGAKNIYRAIDGSLKRLKTDYIDLFWMHIWDGVTPIEEIIQTLQALVQSGKIRYYGFSDMPAWVAMKAVTISNERRRPKPIAMQLEYSLVARSIEREHVPVAIDSKIAIIPWSPLAGGFLTGKYKKENTADSGRLSGPNPFGDSKFTDKNWAILDVVRSVAEEQNCSLSQVALSWLMSQPGVTSTLIGASKLSQVQDNLGALNVILTTKQKDQLSTVSKLTPEFSDSLVSPFIRKLVYGGHEVKSWNDRY
jgi:aryl-alcohol dehydrogenase-like predicted oxidoreductase